MSAKPLHTSLSSLHTFIEEKITLTEKEWLFVAERLETVSINANTLLLREGQVCGHLYFVNKGLMRFFITTSDGKDTTKFFTPEHQLFPSQQSFSTQTPARENIEALEEAELLAVLPLKNYAKKD